MPNKVSRIEISSSCSIGGLSFRLPQSFVDSLLVWPLFFRVFYFPSMKAWLFIIKKKIQKKKRKKQILKTKVPVQS